MFGWLKSDPQKQLKRKIETLLTQARDIQRSGDVVAAAKLYERAEALQQELDSLKDDRPAPR